MPGAEVIEKVNIGGKQFLPICGDCFERVFLVNTTGNNNYLQKINLADGQPRKNWVQEERID